MGDRTTVATYRLKIMDPNWARIVQEIHDTAMSSDNLEGLRDRVCESFLCEFPGVGAARGVCPPGCPVRNCARR